MYTVGNESIEYRKPISLITALKERRSCERSYPFNTNGMLNIFVKELEKNAEISAIPVKRYLGKGSSAIVFETLYGDVLKLTEGSHFPLRRPIEDFDVPIYKMGKIGKIRYYVEEKLFQHGLSEGFVSQVAETIKAKGYKVSDLGSFDIHQIGISNDGKLYLLDPECARYKTIFHALWSKAKNFFKHL